MMPAKVFSPPQSDTRFDLRKESGSTPTSSTKSKTVSISANSRPSSKASEENHAAKAQAPTAVQPVEPEDAYLTGVSRSLQRRLLGLNVRGSQGQSKPVAEAQSAGIHSTGSYTGTTKSARVAGK